MIQVLRGFHRIRDFRRDREVPWGLEVPFLQIRGLHRDQEDRQGQEVQRVQGQPNRRLRPLQRDQEGPCLPAVRGFLQVRAVPWGREVREEKLLHPVRALRVLRGCRQVRGVQRDREVQLGKACKEEESSVRRGRQQTYRACRAYREIRAFRSFQAFRVRQEVQRVRACSNQSSLLRHHLHHQQLLLHRLLPKRTLDGRFCCGRGAP